jgi:glycosyltransferase involved in cell wall biosynthesis
MRNASIAVTVLPCASKSIRGAIHPRTERQRVGYISRVISCYRLIKKINPDIVYINTITRSEVAVAAFLSRKKTVLHVHEGANFLKPKSFMARAKLFMLFLLTQNIICVSKAIRDIVVENIGQKKNIYIVPNGVLNDFSGSEPAEISALREAKNKRDALVVGYCGSLVGRKRPDIFLSAAKLISLRRKNVIFVMVGDEAHAFDALLNRDHELHDMLGSSLIHFPFTSRVDVFLKEMDIFCLTSDVEPFALITLENALVGNGAMVVSDVDGNIEFVVDGETGLLFRAGDHVNLAEQIERLINDASLRKALVIGARRHVEENYNMNAYAEGVEKVLHAV